MVEQKPTVMELALAWEAKKKDEGCSPDHINAIHYFKQNYVEGIGDMAWDELTPLAFREIRAAWGCSPNTANRNLVFFKALLNSAEEAELIANNPIRKVKRLPKSKNVKYVPPREDLDKMYAVCKPERRALFLAYRHTGARKRELLRLKVEDVSLTADNPYLVLYTNKKRDRSRTPRQVPITPDLAETLRPLVEKAEGEYVFTNGGGAPHKGLSRWLPALAERAKVKPFQFHSMRHRFAHDMWERDAPIDDIQYVLGHEDQKTTRIYLAQITVRHGAVKYMYDAVGE